MAIQFSPEEILETVRMVELETLDIRTITIGISLLDCADPSLEAAAEKVYDKICHCAARLVAVGDEIERDYGIPIVNKRISVTPIALVAAASASDDYVPFAAISIARPPKSASISSAASRRSCTRAPRPATTRCSPRCPRRSRRTERVCSSVNVATTRAGINMDAVGTHGRDHRRHRRAHGRSRRHRLREARRASATPSRTTRSWPAHSTASASRTA